MIEFVQKYLWWIVMILITPIVLFSYIVYSINKIFEQLEVNIDEDDGVF